MNFAVSCSWNAFRHDNGAEMLFEIGELGFEGVELSFNLTSSMIKDIEEAQGRPPCIQSLHNYCPIPDGLTRKEALPDCFSMSSLNEEERQLALKYTKRTIDTANRLGARAVVLHCGRVETPDRTQEFISLYNDGLKDSLEFKELKAGVVKERRDLVKPFLEKTLKSLDELNSYAREKGVLLGVETRYYYREIPSLDETGQILDKFNGSQIFYWHDFGHGQVMQNLGFYEHEEYLRRYSQRMIGVHIHGVRGAKDHLPCSKETFNYSLLKPYLNASTLKVIETHYPATKEELLESKKFLEEVLAGK